MCMEEEFNFQVRLRLCSLSKPILAEYFSIHSLTPLKVRYDNKHFRKSIKCQHTYLIRGGMLTKKPFTGKCQTSFLALRLLVNVSLAITYQTHITPYYLKTYHTLMISNSSFEAKNFCIRFNSNRSAIYR